MRLRAWAIAGLVMALAALSGCAGDAQSPGPEIERALASLDGVSNYETKLYMEFKGKTPTASMDMVIANQSSVFLDPYKSASYLQYANDGTNAQIQSFAQMENGKMRQHAYINGTWVHEDVPDVNRPTDAAAQMRVFLESGGTFAVDGDEHISMDVVNENEPTGEKIEFDTTRLKGTLSGAAFEEALRGSLKRLGADVGGKALGAVPAQLWVETATGRPVKLRLELQEVAANALSKDDAPAQIDAAVVEFMLFHVNEAAEVEIPEEALKE